MSHERHSDAIAYYSAALALNPATPQFIFIEQSKAYVAAGLRDLALNDTNKVHPFIPRHASSCSIRQSNLIYHSHEFTG